MRRLQLPELIPDGIEVWQVALDLHAEPDSLWEILSAEERLRAGRFHYRADRVRFAVTRMVVRRLLAERLGCSPLVLRFETGRYGKPCLTGDLGDRPIAFNVAHSGAFALVALAQAETVAQVGVDIEHCDVALDIDALAAYALTPGEREALKYEAYPEVGFLLRWVGKEAVLKAIGMGITKHLQAVSVHPANDNCLVVQHDIMDCPPLQAWALAAPKGYVAALAWCS